MDKIKIGNRTFYLGIITSGVLDVIREKIGTVSISDPDKEGKVDIGEALLFVFVIAQAALESGWGNPV